VVVGPSNIQYLKTNNDFVVTGSTLLALYPKLALAMVLAIRDGVKIPDLVYSPTITVTKQNVSEYFDSNAKLIKVPPLPASLSFLKPYLARLGGALPPPGIS
jgi:ABC-type sugar transport system substrate-binding protein